MESAIRLALQFHAQLYRNEISNIGPAGCDFICDALEASGERYVVIDSGHQTYRILLAAY